MAFERFTVVRGELGRLSAADEQAVRAGPSQLLGAD